MRANGQTFESLDDGLGGDEWKDYARSSDQVWYVGGTSTAVENLLGALPIATINVERDLLPSEGEFQVILIDALDGNDLVVVGPTVQKSVWVDAGAGTTSSASAAATRF